MRPPPACIAKAGIVDIAVFHVERMVDSKPSCAKDETIAIALALTCQQSRMGGSQEDITDVRHALKNVRQCLDCRLNPLARREHAERQQCRLLRPANTPTHAG